MNWNCIFYYYWRFDRIPRIITHCGIRIIDRKLPNGIIKIA